MEDAKPSWPKWVLFFAGVIVFTGVIAFVAFTHVLKGPALTVGIVVWFLAYVAYCYYGSAKLKAGKIGPIMKRYRQRLAVAMITYLFALMGSIGLLKRGGLEGPLLWIVAVAPAIPILAVLAIIGLYLKEEPDEFERAVQVESMLWGLGVVLAVSTVWGFLNTAGVLPAPPLFLIFPLFCAAWPISQIFIRRRYQ